MISFGLAYLWCIIQVTVLSGAVLAVCLCIGRRHPVFRSFIVSTGLGLVLGLSFLLLSPWPKWSVVSSGSDNPSTGSRPVEIGDLLFARRTRQFDGDQHHAPAPLADFSIKTAPITVDGTETTESIATDLRNSEGPQFASSRQLFRVVSKSIQKLNRPDGGLQNWLRYLTIVSLVGIATGAIRLLHGWLSVRNFRAEARLVSDQRLSDALDIAQASLGCVRHIELRESAKLSSPATVGWLRPIIMLPSDWPEWSEDECLGVIAHEVAHVRRGDFFTWFLAQCALVLHFYHPFVHWLVSGLRLEQELAADAAAAGVVGSHRSYLRMLATMASREADRPPHRMLRTFLPTQGTLVARLEMLRSQRLVAGPGSSSKRVFVVAILFSFGLVAAGLRGEIIVGGDAELKLDYVPDAALLAVALRPGRLIDDRLLSEFGIDPQQAQFCGVPLTSLEQVTLFVLAQGAERQGATPEFSGLVVHARTTTEARALLCRATGISLLDDETAKGLVEPTDSGAFFGSHPEAKTVVLTLRHGDLGHALAAGPQSNRPAAWLHDWNECGGSDLRVYAAVRRLRPILERLPARPPEIDQFYTAIEPAWQSADSVTLGCTLRDGLQIQVLWRTREDAQVEASQSALAAGIETANEQLEQAILIRRGSNERGAAEWHDACCWLRLLTSRLALAKYDEHGISLAARLTEGEMRQELPESADVGPRLAKILVGDRNHLMLIRIQRALDLYRKDHGDFPPLIITPEGDGTPPFSWRVAILPYMGQINLYERYNFAEPWNSESNLKLLSEMPDCYADAIDTPGTPFASVVRVATQSGGSVGLDRVDGDGVTDGELLLIMNRKTSIPWTSPVDLEVPEFGDLCDRLDLRTGHHTLTIDPDGRTLRYAFLVTPSAATDSDRD